MPHSISWHSQLLPASGNSCIKLLISLPEFHPRSKLSGSTRNAILGGFPSLRKISSSYTISEGEAPLFALVSWSKAVLAEMPKACKRCKQSMHPLEAVTSTESNVLIRRICFLSGSCRVSLISVMTRPLGYWVFKRLWHFQHSSQFSIAEVDIDGSQLRDVTAGPEHSSKALRSLFLRVHWNTKLRKGGEKECKERRERRKRQKRQF